MLKIIYIFNIITFSGEIIMMYEIDDLFFASVNKEVTIISYSQYADLIKESLMKKI